MYKCLSILLIIAGCTCNSNSIENSIQPKTALPDNRITSSRNSQQDLDCRFEFMNEQGNPRDVEHGFILWAGLTTVLRGKCNQSASLKITRLDTGAVSPSFQVWESERPIAGPIEILDRLTGKYKVKIDVWQTGEIAWSRTFDLSYE